MKAIARLLAVLSLALGSLSLFRVRTPAGAALLIPKVVAAALAPYVALTGLIGATLGLVRRSPLAVATGGVGAILAGDYVRRVAAPHRGFECAFGTGWERRVPPEQERSMLRHRWTWRIPDAPEPAWERDIGFWTIPGSDRRLLCDVWQPPSSVHRSGLAIVYLHGSAWYLLDKDVGTRPLFSHLAAQGHVVMDVAYRLCPEVGIEGMVGDAKRAVAWMKANAQKFGVNPERVVLVGASAGGQVALLAAYTPGRSELTPDELRGVDTSVRAVVSYYGNPDLRAYCAHTAARLLDRPVRPGAPREQAHPSRVAASITRRLFGRALPSQELPPHWQMMRDLLGGQPEEVPAMCELASPISHVKPSCPPTLLFQGEHDFVVPVAAVRRLYRTLLAAGVAAVYVEFPRTEHAFDILFPRLAPAGQAALYDLERFLALVAGPEEFRPVDFERGSRSHGAAGIAPAEA